MYNMRREAVNQFCDLADDISTDAASIRRTIRQANRQSIKLDMALLPLELNVFQFLTLLGHCHFYYRGKPIRLRSRSRDRNKAQTMEMLQRRHLVCRQRSMASSRTYWIATLAGHGVAEAGIMMLLEQAGRLSTRKMGTLLQFPRPEEGRL
jgi:hypothetical protein